MVQGGEVMRLTEHTVNAFVIGAAIGSIITYFITTQEKRMLSAVRGQILHFSLFLPFEEDVPFGRYGKLGNELRARDIIAWYNHAQHFRHSTDSEGRKHKKLNAVCWTALAIICDKILKEDYPFLCAADALSSPNRFENLRRRMAEDREKLGVPPLERIPVHWPVTFSEKLRRYFSKKKPSV
jgi:hypothetical protein